MDRLRLRWPVDDRLRYRFCFVIKRLVIVLISCCWHIRSFVFVPARRKAFPTKEAGDTIMSKNLSVPNTGDLAKSPGRPKGRQAPKKARERNGPRAKSKSPNPSFCSVLSRVKDWELGAFTPKTALADNVDILNPRYIDREREKVDACTREKYLAASKVEMH